MRCCGVAVLRATPGRCPTGSRGPLLRRRRLDLHRWRCGNPAGDLRLPVTQTELLLSQRQSNRAAPGPLLPSPSAPDTTRRIRQPLVLAPAFLLSTRRGVQSVERQWRFDVPLSSAPRHGFGQGVEATSSGLQTRANGLVDVTESRDWNDVLNGFDSRRIALANAAESAYRW